jgi:hypothetical protein
MKDCIIITSVVQTTNKPLSYSQTRSLYSHQQRFEQTLETIESVRKYMPDVHILLIECSPHSEWMEQLKVRVDQFINLEFHDLINNSLEKGLGEKTLLLHALSNLTDTYDNIYKITGRYVLQNKIEWEPSELPTFCRTNLYGMKNGVHTFFYRIPNSKLSLFKEILESYEGIGCIENWMTSKLETQINYVDKIGILVRWACYDEIEYC